MNLTKIPDKKKVDHLILLVGGNPLPNVIAGSLLLNPQGRITLVHSAETAHISDRLVKWFQTNKICDPNNLKPVETSATKRRVIYDTITALVKSSQGAVGLHYSSGTKAMAVHAHAAARKAKAAIVCSYLDAQTLCLVFDDGVRRYVGMHPHYSLSVEDLFELHGTPLHRKNASTVQNQVLPDASKDQKGELFEKEVGRALQSIAKEVGVHDFWMNVEAKIPQLPKEGPEFDIVALRGYQLFFISCGTTSSRSTLKLKLLEAYVRAQQIGGSEACVALACQKSDPTLELELQQTLQVEGRVRVFSTSTTSDLASELRGWIIEQSKQGASCQ